MKVNIVIPSKNRIEKLENCLNSILKATVNFSDVNIYLFFSEESEKDYFDSVFKGISNIIINTYKEYKVPEFWNNFVQKYPNDNMIYLNDDVEIFEDTIEKAISIFEYCFPNNDGILGFNQVNITDPNKCLSAFGMVGYKYPNIFPNRQFLCSDYYRFYSDNELFRYSTKINKFYYSEEIKLIHHHPCTDRSLMDSTHKEVREYLKKDKDTFRNRQKKGLLWGESFTLINNFNK